MVRQTTLLDYMPDDGYTEAGFIKAVENVHGDFRFRYRPVLVEVRSQHLAASDTMKPDQFDRKTAALLTDQITDWSLVGDSGGAIVIHATNLLRLKPVLFERLYLIIFGLAAGDTDPEWTESEKDQQTAAIYESAISGTDLGSAKEAAAVKNSDEG